MKQRWGGIAIVSQIINYTDEWDVKIKVKVSKNQVNRKKWRYPQLTLIISAPTAPVAPTMPTFCTGTAIFAFRTSFIFWWNVLAWWPEIKDGDGASTKDVMRDLLEVTEFWAYIGIILIAIQPLNRRKGDSHRDQASTKRNGSAKMIDDATSDYKRWWSWFPMFLLLLFLLSLVRRVSHQSMSGNDGSAGDGRSLGS